MLLAVTLTLMGCPQRTAVWIVEGSNARNLVFGLSDHRGGERPVFSGLRVDFVGPTAEDRRMVWGVFPHVDFRGELSARIRLGEVPTGYEAVRDEPGPLLPLRPGCYRAWASGTGRASFVVLPDERVFEVQGRCLPPTGDR